MVLVVGIHEAGHALSARFFKVNIRRISIGFGKALLSWKDQTKREWVWGLWPLGGYAQLLNSRIETLPSSDFRHCFDKKPIWQRCIILISGSLANFITAFLALFLLYLLGYQQHTPLIKDLRPQTIAAEAGLQANDRFLAIDNQPTNSWQEVGMSLIMALGKSKVPIQVSNQEGRVRTINLDLSKWHYQNKERSLFLSLGLNIADAKSSKVTVPGQSFFFALSSALAKLLFLLKFFFIMIKQLVNQHLPFAILLGPFGMIETTIVSFSQGLTVFLYFIASFSLAVGLVNLFPFPGLDGGSIAYALIEKFRGKPISLALEILLHRLAFILFFILLFQLVLNDIQRYLSS